jgi:hypothetical protein
VRRIKIVLVLEKYGWGAEVLEHCALSELHPASAGLEVLKGWKMVRMDVSFFVSVDLRKTDPPPLCGAGAF